jgi:UMF1 family MFS transporter
MYDFANQSFTLLIITLLFPLYFKKVAVTGEMNADSMWSITFSSSMLVVVLLSPFVGAIADARGWKKEFLMVSGVLCIALTCSFALIGQGGWALAMALFIPANICYQMGENFLASFLPEISETRTIGRISATGWTMGYVGALCLLVITAVMMRLMGMQREADWGPLFVFAGLWFLVGMIAPMLFLKDRAPKRLGEPLGRVAADALIRMRETVRQASHFAQLARFFVAFFIYAMGVQTMIAFASIIANDFGFTQTKLVLFVLQLTVTAGIGSVVTLLIQDRIGIKRCLLLFLGVWVLTCAGMSALTVPASPPEWMFWVVGNGVGLGMGGIGTSSRAMVGRFTPRQKTAEFFGLWGMVYKGAGVVGVFIFGQVKGFDDTLALAMLGVFFLGGLAIVLSVSESRGYRAAMQSQRAHERRG